MDQLEFPLFIVLSACNVSVNEISVARTLAPDINGKPCLPLFTDTGIAGRFIEANAVDKAITVTIANEYELLEVLEEVMEDGIEEEVIIDYQANASFNLKIRIETAIDAIKND